MKAPETTAPEQIPTTIIVPPKDFVSMKEWAFQTLTAQHFQTLMGFLERAKEVPLQYTPINPPAPPVAPTESAPPKGSRKTIPLPPKK